MLSQERAGHILDIYMLVSLYLIKFSLQDFIEKVSERMLRGVMIVLIAGTFIIPSINVLFEIELENYMISN